MPEQITWLWATILLVGGILLGVVLVWITGYFALHIVLRHLSEQEGPLIKREKPQDIADTTGADYE